MFGCRVTSNQGEGDWHQLVITGSGNRWSPIGVGKWLKDLGIFGQRSHQKQLPGGVFSLPNSQVALFLQHLWATDGSITVRKGAQRGGHAVSFSTCSRRLADDVGALLLRLGIGSRIHTVKVGYYRPVYLVCVSSESQQAFLEQVGAFGPRREAAQWLAEALHEASASTQAEWRMGAVAAGRAQMTAQGMSRSAVAGSRSVAAQTAGFTSPPGTPGLEPPSTSDLLWDRVIAINPDGEEDVFDLTVPGPACWLADGVVSHNSGSLEQDADMILLIYREEVYDRNTTRKGIAEIDLVKHRNGEIGTFVLTFQGQYTRFANYVSDSYAEGVLR
jgi:replicative DNA helicase